MITYEDCLGLCNLTQEEIDSIAKREHVPVIIALELGCPQAILSADIRPMFGQAMHKKQDIPIGPEVLAAHKDQSCYKAA